MNTAGFFLNLAEVKFLVFLWKSQEVFLSSMANASPTDNVEITFLHVI